MSTDKSKGEIFDEGVKVGVESIRQALMAVFGEVDTVTGKELVDYLNSVEVRNNTNED